MAKSNPAEERVKIQIPLPPAVFQSLTDWARKMDRSHAWMAGWCIGFMMHEEGEFAKAINQRLKTLEKTAKRVSKPEGQDDIRIQIRVLPETLHWLELLAASFFHTPGKLAAIIIDATLETQTLGLRIASSKIGKGLRYVIGEAGPKNRFDDTDEQQNEQES